jgi:hypothetical protein
MYYSINLEGLLRVRENCFAAGSAAPGLRENPALPWKIPLGPLTNPRRDVTLKRAKTKAENYIKNIGEGSRFSAAERKRTFRPCGLATHLIRIMPTEGLTMLVSPPPPVRPEGFFLLSRKIRKANPHSDPEVFTRKRESHPACHRAVLPERKADYERLSHPNGGRQEGHPHP